MISLLDRIGGRLLTAALDGDLERPARSRLVEAEERLARAHARAETLATARRFATPASLALGCAIGVGRR